MGPGHLPPPLISRFGSGTDPCLSSFILNSNKSLFKLKIINNYVNHNLSGAMLDR